MMVIRLEQDTETEAQRDAQLIAHGLKAPTQYAHGPREALLRDLRDAWRPDHRPLTLREEVDARERGPRQNLLHELRNAHLPDAAERNRRDVALAHLEPRARLAVETRDMWRRP